MVVTNEVQSAVESNINNAKVVATAGTIDVDSHETASIEALSESVVTSSVMILAMDFILTLSMYGEFK